MRAFARVVIAALLLALLFIAVLGGLSGVSMAADRPPGCPHAWCGCWLGKRLGLHDRSLWLARNWSRVGQSLDGPRKNAVVVWRHHVGLVIGVQPGKIMVLSGNDGHRVRARWRSMRGVIAWRDVSGRAFAWAD